jgi:hypothetical protein
MEAKLSKPQAIRMIDRYFDRMRTVFDADSEEMRYMAQQTRDERDHRHFAPDGLELPLTVARAARLFYVQDVFEAMRTDYTFEAKQLLWMRKGYTFAAGMAQVHDKELREAFTDQEQADFLSLIDYADLMITD